MLQHHEFVHYEDVELAAAVSQAAVDAAAALEDEELLMRAQLIQAHSMMRQGRIAEAGLNMRRINAWAIEHSNPTVLASSHRLLSGFFFRLGDAHSALEHALHSLEYLPETTFPQIRGKHLMTLALALDSSGDYEASHQRFDELLDICLATNHVQQMIYTLNNLAYSSCQLGYKDKAAELAAKIRAVTDKHNISLAVSQLDTIARVELMLGRPQVAVQTLLPVLDKHRSGGHVGDIYSLPDCQLTVVEAHLQLGSYRLAQETLDEARLLCEAYGLKGFLVKIRLAQSQLYAAEQRYKEAYEEHCRYHEDSEALRSSEREARARILQTVFETEEARRTSEHYRELSHRDPLTGLYNRRYIDAYMDRYLEQCEAGEEHTVVLIDLDHFKTINDKLSHKTGDAVLVRLAKILEASAVEPAQAARLGGEEFLIYCPGYNLEKGLDFAERLCGIIRSADWSPITGTLAVTASIGVCSTRCGQTDRAALLSEADGNLYQAKNTGRNRVVGSQMK
ncbi:GGDEF domain-containing protein [Paenibacillus turpanensis]|uniref:GGDEF domain-containing protein n=1 Tax=Paenibacillus turpanensis TaxID=2689078 RepID=UPI00140BE0C1|nr:GGDEF domain-containing protein [Paenibacillus turpanensis]